MTREDNRSAGAQLASGIVPVLVPFAKAGGGRAYQQAIGLAVAGAAIGRSVLLQTTDGRRSHPGLNVLVATDTPGPVMDTVASIIAPLKYLQTRLHLALAKLDSECHHRLIEEVAAERAEYVASDGMPAPEHLAYFDQQLVELSGVSKPMMLLENPPPGRLTLAVGKSACTALLALYDDLSLTALLNAARTTRGAMDFELLAKSWRQEIFDAAYLEGVSDAAVVSPVVSMMAVARPETVARLLTSTEPLVAGFADGCMVVYDPNDTLAGVEPAPPALANANWQQIVCRLLASRGEATRIIGLSSEAGNILACFRRQIAERHRNVPAAEAPQAARVNERFLDHLPKMAGKTALILHLRRDGVEELVTGDEAEQAGAIAGLSTKHRLTLLESGGGGTARRSLRTTVSQKIIAFGPLSTRDICRHTNGLKVDVLMPILHDLMQAGEAAKEPDGRYSAVMPAGLRVATG